MAQGLKTLAVVLPEYPSSIPCTHVAAHVCNSSSEGFDILTHIDTHAGKAQTDINLKKKNYLAGR